MKRSTLAIVATLLPALGVAPALRAQEAEQAPPCSLEEHRQFDFWIGEWEVVNTADDQVVGQNTISPVMNGCALEENWVGGQGGKGTSLNVYNAASGSWHQTWISDTGTFLLLAGGWKDGSMVLQGEMTGAGGGKVMHRIAWTPGESGEVRQIWEFSRDGGEAWTTAFDGTYRPKS